MPADLPEKERPLFLPYRKKKREKKGEREFPQLEKRATWSRRNGIVPVKKRFIGKDAKPELLLREGKKRKKGNSSQSRSGAKSKDGEDSEPWQSVRGFRLPREEEGKKEKRKIPLFPNKRGT